MVCCCDPLPSNCSTPGPCRPCAACEGEAYPANWLLQAEPSGCFAEAWLLVGAGPLPFQARCYCGYGCVVFPAPNLYAAGLSIFPHPGHKRAYLLLQSQGTIDVEITYFTNNWNCCGANVLQLSGDGCPSGFTPPTRTLTPYLTCACQHPSNSWCSHRPAVLNCLVREILAGLPQWFNNQTFPIPFISQGVIPFGWAANILDPDNNRLNVNLVCHDVGTGRYSMSAAMYDEDDNVLIEGNDLDGSGTTSTCRPAFYDGRCFDPDFPTTPFIRGTWTE